MKGVSLTDMNEDGEKVNSIRRNEIITQIFDWNQHAELNASGIALIQHKARERNLPPPLIELIDKEHVVKITLYRPYRKLSSFETIENEVKIRLGPFKGQRVVFISSTARELALHRDQVRMACERAGFRLMEMIENPTALDKDAVDASLRMVEEADVYLGVFGYRYGTIPTGFDRSITEMEYDHAAKLDKPCLVFFIDADHPVRVIDIETGEGAAKLKALKERIGQQRIVAFFKSDGDLRAQVFEALTGLAKKLDAAEADDQTARAAAPLYRTSGIPTPPGPYVAHPYTLHTRDVVGRSAELNILTDWVANPESIAVETRVFCFVAVGGMGKSALAWKWFNQIAPNEMRPLAGRLWWSFYESDDANFEDFLVRALCYVSGQSEDKVRALAWQEREAQLLRHLNDEPYLFVLDGLERILIACHRIDASYLADDEHNQRKANWVIGAVGLPASAAQPFEHRLRQTIDPRAGRCLQKLAQLANSRILITARLYPAALQLPNGQARPGCFAYFLQGLSDDDALDLWHDLNKSGSRADLVPIFRSLEGHPLLIQTLASEVANYRKAPGDFVQWSADHPHFDPASVVQSRTHILQFALDGLSTNIREVLHTLVCLRMPASYATLEALLVGQQDKACHSAEELDRALTELEDRGLIGWDRVANRYDAHPIVRGAVLQSMAGDTGRSSDSGAAAGAKGTS